MAYPVQKFFHVDLGEGVQEQGAEKDIWALQGTGGNCIMTSLTSFTLQQTLRG
jgi:hypothetical protein